MLGVRWVWVIVFLWWLMVELLMFSIGCGVLGVLLVGVLVVKFCMSFLGRVFLIFVM